ncbi:TetR/AcrR family transcriptional regulator [Weissella fangxianensis]|uniref:TetR/AcrR family transcriptional regulator n=1 Tax=Weissella fangxianensis TaxID=2953879 RepID=UPI0021579FB5|nr:TetR/AcrR family transcriptional regulator [Weissella fangxianensis]
MNKQLQQNEKTKQALKTSFLRLYNQEDIEKITIKQITDGANVYRSTFYIHFTDIYALLDLIEQEEIESFSRYIQQNFEKATIEGFMQLVIHYFESKGNLLFLLIQKSHHNEFSTKIKQTLVNIIKNTLGIQNQDNVEVAFSLEYIADSFIFLLKFWHEQKDMIPISDLYPFAMDILHHGVIDKLLPFSTKNPDTIKKL